MNDSLDAVLITLRHQELVDEVFRFLVASLLATQLESTIQAFYTVVRFILPQATFTMCQNRYLFGWKLVWNGVFAEIQMNTNVRLGLSCFRVLGGFDQ